MSFLPPAYSHAMYVVLSDCAGDTKMVRVKAARASETNYWAQMKVALPACRRGNADGVFRPGYEISKLQPAAVPPSATWAISSLYRPIFRGNGSWKSK